MKMKAVIQTQFLENYGAHDWDGQGECPQYWKPKGGDTYVIDISISQNMDIEFWKHLMSFIEYSGDYAREYSVGETIVDDIDFKESDYAPNWDAPYYLKWLDDGRLHSTRTSFWDEWRHDEIAGDRKTFILAEGGDQEDFLLEYILKDGITMTYQQWTNRITDTRSVA
jgi:hypothetical protein